MLLTTVFLFLLSLVYAAQNNATSPPGANNGASAKMQALSDGIGTNILLQMAEQSAAVSLQNYQKATAGTAGTNQAADNATFSALKSQLLAIVQTGAAIRAQNQAIAGTNSPATKGLAIVANAQKAELSGAMALTGKDPSKDAAVLAQLQSEFAGGIKQNRDNQNAVMAQMAGGSNGTKKAG